MPRPHKWKKIRSLPEYDSFAPRGVEKEPAILMSVDEFEAIRLIDLEGMTQEECAQQMEVARTTAQAIYNRGRKKLAECLVHGYPLEIAGGNYRLCSEERANFPGEHCPQHSPDCPKRPSMCPKHPHGAPLDCPRHIPHPDSLKTMPSSCPKHAAHSQPVACPEEKER